MIMDGFGNIPGRMARGKANEKPGVPAGEMPGRHTSEVWLSLIEAIDCA
jgi:hypothetical protein